MDKLVQAIYFEGYVLLFMESGKIYRMDVEKAIHGQHSFILIGEVPNV